MVDCWRIEYWTVNFLYKLNLVKPILSNVLLFNDGIGKTQGFVFTQAFSEIWSLSIDFKRTACKLGKKIPANYFDIMNSQGPKISEGNTNFREFRGNIILIE
jgi:hypothetical protein